MDVHFGYEWNNFASNRDDVALQVGLDGEVADVADRVPLAREDRENIFVPFKLL